MGSCEYLENKKINVSKNMPKKKNEYDVSEDDGTCPNISIKQYRSLKRRLKQLEAENCNRVMMIPCNGKSNWYEMAEHSALFYYHEVCQPLNKKTKFFADTESYYDEYGIGYIRSKGVANVRKNLQELRLYSTEYKEGEIYVFILKKDYSKEEIEKLKAAEEDRRVWNLTPKPVSNLDPGLYRLIVSTATRLHKACSSRLDKLSSSVNGAEIVRLADSLIEDYLVIVMLKPTSKAKIKARLENMRRTIYLLIIKVKILGELRLWNLELCISLTEPLYEIKDKIDQNLVKFIRKGEI